MLYGIVPINKTVAGVLGAVVALLAFAVVGVTVGWRLSVTRNRKSYKKWNEEVRAGCAFMLVCALPSRCSKRTTLGMDALLGVGAAVGCPWMRRVLISMSCGDA